MNIHDSKLKIFTKFHEEINSLTSLNVDVIDPSMLLHQYIEHCSIIYIYIYISGGPLSALTCCVNVRLLSAIKKISPLIYSQSWVGSWVYTTQAMMTFTLIF